MANKGKGLQSITVVCDISFVVFTLLLTYLLCVFIVFASALVLAETWTFVNMCMFL